MDRGEILDEAKNLTYGDRAGAHGDPYNNHRRIGVLMGIVLEEWMKTATPGDPVPAAVTAQLMVAMKLARLSFKPDHADSAIDGAAYFAIASELASKPE